MSAINDIQNQVIDEFSLFDDPMDRNEYLIEIGKKLSPLDEKYKTDEFIINGCQAKVWLHAFEENGKVFFEADSNAFITKGIVGLLVRVLSGHTPEEILNTDLYFIDKIDLRSHLISQRSNGLSAMIKQMKLYAIGYQQIIKSRYKIQG